jgi:hypothetical protein
MRIARIEIASGEPTPKVIAILSRVPGVRYIDIEVLHDDGRRFEHHVPAASAEDRWSMAERLQHAFDGVRGAGGDIREFNRLLDLLGD